MSDVATALLAERTALEQEIERENEKYTSLERKARYAVARQMRSYDRLEEMRADLGKLDGALAALGVEAAA